MADIEYKISEKRNFVTVREAAAVYHLSEEQVRRNLRSGKFRGARIGGQWFVDVEDEMSKESIYRERMAMLERIRVLRERIIKRRGGKVLESTGAEIIGEVREEWFAES